MQHHLLLGGLTLAIVASLPAQTPTFTTPRGFDRIEGSSVHDYILFSYNKMRFQQVDSTNKGAGAKVLRSLAFRRDGVLATRPWASRTQDVTILLAEGVAIPSVTTSFAANYLNPPTTVFTTKNVSLPDWTALPTTPPAAFDLKFAFDVPWLYTGTNNFLWEILGDNLSTQPGTYGNDYQSEVGTAPRTDTGIALGTGCIVGTNTLGFALNQTVTNHATKFSMTSNLLRGPASAPALLFLDYANRNLNVPGLCAPVYALPTLNLLLGATDGTGTLTGFLVDNLPYDVGLVGARLFFQALAVELTRPIYPVALTNGSENNIPATPGPQQVARIYEYSLGTSMRAASQWTGSLVTQYEH